MAKQLQKSEQITQSLSLVYDYDQPMTKMSEFESAFRDALGDIEVIKYGTERIHPIKYTNNNQDTYFLIHNTNLNLVLIIHLHCFDNKNLPS